MIFGVLTIRFANEMGTGSSNLARWLAGGIGIFRLIRAALQWCFYSDTHQRGKTKETVVHWTLTFAYSGYALVYLTAAFHDHFLRE